MDEEVNRVYFGDCRDTLRDLIAEGVKVQMCVTSPPYWGLRDYGTSKWVGGDSRCRHQRVNGGTAKSGLGNYANGITLEAIAAKVNERGRASYKHVCGKCGAQRVDKQIGLEPLHDCQAWTRAHVDYDYEAETEENGEGVLVPTGKYLRVARAGDGFTTCGKCHVCILVDVFRLVRDLLHDDGTLWLNYGDCYSSSGGAGWQGKHGARANRTHSQRNLKARSARNGLKPKDMALMPARIALALQADGWWVRNDIIWHKPNPMPESVEDRMTKAHEYLFLLAKSERYYFDAEAIKEPASPDTHARLARAHSGYAAPGQDKHHGMLAPRPNGVNPKARIPSGWDTGDGNHRKLAGRYQRGTKQNESFAAATSGRIVEDRNKRTVWTIPTSPFQEAHFATFPPELIEPCILAGSRPGDIVLDPFFGSGTTGEVCQNLGRNWIGCELQRDYESMQRRRTAQLGIVLA